MNTYSKSKTHCDSFYLQGEDWAVRGTDLSGDQVLQLESRKEPGWEDLLKKSETTHFTILGDFETGLGKYPVDFGLEPGGYFVKNSRYGSMFQEGTWYYNELRLDGGKECKLVFWQIDGEKDVLIIDIDYVYGHTHWDSKPFLRGHYSKDGVDYPIYFFSIAYEF